MQSPYVILEVASTHGGDLNYLLRLLDEFANYDSNYGIKFQPFEPDEIARRDYEYYNVYKELFFDPVEWQRIIKKAAATKDVWVDVSNNYSLRIISENKEHIKGIKFQASILDNIQLLHLLGKTDLSNISLIINVASLTKEEITGHLQHIRSLLKPKEIFLQIGFQDYPTRPEDSGLSKIDDLKKWFGLPISFADHIEGSSDISIDLPVAAYLKGACIIEKHVMCSGEKAKYDHFSSQTPDQFEKLNEKLQWYKNLLDQPFINEREKLYYTKTVMKPTLAKDLEMGQIISLEHDVNFKRTNEDGLDLSAIKQLNKDHFVLIKPKQEGQMLRKEDFRKACIASIIAGRLKSSRLPKKAILKVNQELTTIELCLKNALQFTQTQYTVLATSTNAEDDELKNYIYDKKVLFRKGDPEDVIQRYLDVIDELQIDVFIRITADMPYVPNEIVEYLIDSHFEKGADYTAPRKAALGQGIQIINAAALRKVRKYFPISDFSEYMNAYIIHNPQLFKINEVDLPEEYIREYRLTIDYPEDLELVRKIEEHFETNGKDFSMKELFSYLDTHPEVAKINKNLNAVYQTDPKLIEEIIRRTTYKGEA